jgi:hypothetical protein
MIDFTEKMKNLNKEEFVKAVKEALEVKVLEITEEMKKEIAKDLVQK